jgi:hypothetical protein
MKLGMLIIIYWRQSFQDVPKPFPTGKILKNAEVMNKPDQSLSILLGIELQRSI